MPHSCQADGRHVPVDIDSVLAEAEAIIAQHQLRLGGPNTGMPLLFWDALFFERRAVERFLEEELVSTAPFYRAVATRAFPSVASSDPRKLGGRRCAGFNSVNRSPLRTGPSETSHDQAYS